MITPLPEDAPAFPVPGLQDDPDFNGITARDYFAIKVLQGMMSGTWTWSDLQYQVKQGASIMENNALCAYEMADAMLKARQA